MPNRRYRIENLAKLNCFSRFLSNICATLIEKIYDAVAPFVPKRKKRRYDRIMQNITDEDKFGKITHRDAMASSRAVRFFVAVIDAVVAVLTVGMIIYGVVQYFRFLQ